MLVVVVHASGGGRASGHTSEGLARNVRINFAYAGTFRYYTSGVISVMLKAGEPFVALKLNAGSDMHVLGTPGQVRDFRAQ